ncbi:outer membrane beta-barrel protein [Vibrio parahaemolyticus]|uniref:outer membrane beta-barrel protein n=1 Tax=Vibrio mediterranei TaxID=689 RepID=UPI004068C9B3
MKNALKLSPLALIVFTTTAVQANSAPTFDSEVEPLTTREYAGHRIGAGLVSGAELTTDLHFDKEWGWNEDRPQHVKHVDPLHGFKIEYGYDFNRVLALNVGYTNLSHNVQDNHTIGMNSFNYYKSSQANFDSLNVEAELGYAFALGKFDLKPYAAAGIGFTQGSSSTFIETDSNHNYEHKRVNDTDTYLAVGARLNTPIGLYIDARAGGIVDDTFTITTGYKF